MTRLHLFLHRGAEQPGGPDQENGNEQREDVDIAIICPQVKRAELFDEGDYEPTQHGAAQPYGYFEAALGAAQVVAR